MSPSFVLLRFPIQAGRLMPIPNEGTIVLGRSKGCGLPVDDPSVSRRHAELAADADGIRITDLGSKNGTFIDGARIAGTATAKPGSRIRFGDLAFQAAVDGVDANEPDSDKDTAKPANRDRREAWRTGEGGLSDAQLRVYRLLVAGLPEKRIASRLGLRKATVHNHVSAIYRAFGVHSRAELLVRALGGG